MTSDKIIAVWIDHAKARIFELKANEVVSSYQQDSNVDFERTNLLQPKDTLHEVQKEELKQFYVKVESLLQNADNVLLMGPGMAKTDLLSHIKKKGALKGVSITSISQDSISDNQIIQLAQKEMDWDLKHIL